jgi:hypothetical protein
MSQKTSEMVLTKAVTVDLPVEEAFRLYTEGVATWWPYSTHSVEGKNVETVAFENRGRRSHLRAGEERRRARLGHGARVGPPESNRAQLASRAG